eukprot:1352747-Amorphochlora_amoeboformis.AAC.2
MSKKCRIIPGFPDYACGKLLVCSDVMHETGSTYFMAQRRATAARSTKSFDLGDFAWRTLACDIPN